MFCHVLIFYHLSVLPFLSSSWILFILIMFASASQHSPVLIISFFSLWARGPVAGGQARIWRSSKELEVQPRTGGPGDGVQKGEGSEAGGPGAKASGLVAGLVFRGAFRCPRVVEKARVTLPSFEVKVSKAFPFTPCTNEFIHCLLHKVLTSCHLGRPGWHIGSWGVALLS